jgi:hypothetical protein
LKLYGFRKEIDVAEERLLIGGRNTLDTRLLNNYSKEQ